MKINLLTHVVPTLPPQAGQVGEYALNLARHLRDDFGINSQFILCDPQWDGSSRIEDFVVRRLRFPNEAGLWSFLASIKKDPAVLLHYDGHSYHKHGIPRWLYRGIKSWLNEHHDQSAAGHKQFFSTVFHELWGTTAKPWQGKFYLQIIQKRLVQRLHRRSQISITNTRHQQILLDAIEPRKTLLLPPPGSAPPVDRLKYKRRRDGSLRVAILDWHGSPTETVRAHANLLRTLDRTNRLAEAILLGANPAESETVREGLLLLQKIVAPGRIEIQSDSSSVAAAECLGRADVLLTSFGGETAGKSSVFMSALAMGCPTILRDCRNAAPFREREHFIVSDDSESCVEQFGRLVAAGELERIAIAGQLWCQRHADWRVVARKYMEAFEQENLVSDPVKSELMLPLWRMAAPAH